MSIGTDPENVLQEAHEAVEERLKRSYGHPAANFDKLRPMWEGILGTQVSDDQIAFCLVALKMARHLTSPTRDNLVDIAGYARVAELCHAKGFPGSWAVE